MNTNPNTSLNQFIKQSKPWYKKGSLLIISIGLLFLFIGILTSIKPAYRLSSNTINEWTRQIDGASFLYFMGMENRLFEEAFPESKDPLSVSNLMFQMATSLKPNDPRTLLGRELPGFDAYNGKIIVAGEGTDYTNLPIESAAPLDVVLEDREAKMPEEEVEQPPEQSNDTNGQPTTGDRNVVFLYTTHNRESFLPHLPEGTSKDEAYHSEVNISKVSNRLASSLKSQGIGSQVDHTDFMNVLNQKGWEYWQSYTASKPIVEEALATNKNIQYIFDIHRDSQGKEETTTTIDGKSYARFFFIVGSDNPDNETNLKLATDLHNKLNEMYPGISRGVKTQGGSGFNGVYNQDLSDQSVIVEIGGVENNMKELYRSADALAKVFSEYYWQAEKVQGNP
ncbi:stage II sporulation protein P [Radiobacillus kanasensis]|uniref:stage II sporulation protein P n=1 Tax=Radiobacillus kanasensis TaxID=2844358 RepID=UPI001E3350C9|nr:stage II sporulation protein P [Radiobacillus kanasensis]UFT97831.1 stage II sporulation protein P [Radiobacillus kanasensis]